MKSKKKSPVKVNRLRPRKNLTISKKGLQILAQMKKYYESESRTIDAALEALAKARASN